VHGSRSQAQRERAIEAFRRGHAQVLVATDVAARGIHIDDVAVVVHWNPVDDPKDYVHRSGRTARAGAEGTVVTLMTDDQVRDVRDLTRKAGIAATVTKLSTGDPLLSELAPGERTYVEPAATPVQTERVAGATGSGSGRGNRRRRASGSAQPATGKRSSQPGAGQSSGGSRGSGRSRSRAGSGGPKSYSTSTPGSAARPAGAAAFSAGSRAGGSRRGR
jgi:superfamily II DNA/RNA helicase